MRVTIRRQLASVLALASVAFTAGCGGGGDAGGGDLVKIVAAHQPALHALPTVIGIDKGWFEEVGLEVEMQIYDSGAPQIEAGASGEWSVGALGTVPMLVGASKYDMQMIGMSNDESSANAIYVRGDADTSDPQALLEGSKILATTISTGEYAMRACLKKYDVPPSSVDVVQLDQSAVLSSSVTGEGDVFQYWAPNNYSAEEIDGQKLLCSGADAGVMVPGAIVATADALKSDPEAVTKWLAVYMRGMNFMRTNKEESLDYLRDYYSEQGIDLTDESLMKELETRPLPDVQEQLDWMKGTDAGTAPAVMQDIASFFVDAGTLDEVPAPDSYIDPSPMESVAEDYADFVTSD